MCPVAPWGWAGACVGTTCRLGRTAHAPPASRPPGREPYGALAPPPGAETSARRSACRLLDSPPGSAALSRRSWLLPPLGVSGRGAAPRVHGGWAGWLPSTCGGSSPRAPWCPRITSLWHARTVVGETGRAAGPRHADFSCADRRSPPQNRVAASEVFLRDTRHRRGPSAADRVSASGHRSTTPARGRTWRVRLAANDDMPAGCGPARLSRPAPPRRRHTPRASADSTRPTRPRPTAAHTAFRPRYHPGCESLPRPCTACAKPGGGVYAPTRCLAAYGATDHGTRGQTPPLWPNRSWGW